MTETTHGSIHQQFAFTDDGDLEPTSESVETSLADFGADVDTRERESRPDQPTASSIHVRHSRNQAVARATLRPSTPQTVETRVVDAALRAVDGIGKQSTRVLVSAGVTDQLELALAWTNPDGRADLERALEVLAENSQHTVRESAASLWRHLHR